MIELIRSKQAGQTPPKEKPSAPPPNVIKLMDALRLSIEAGNGQGKPGAKREPAKLAARPRRKAAKG
jgi:non-homologous end joining protein Ku